MSKKKDRNIRAEIIEADYGATLKYYQILEKNFGIKIESGITVENGLSTYTEKVSKTVTCNSLFNFVFNPHATTIITPTQRNELLAKLVTMLDYAEKFLELADEAKKVGLRFLRFDVDMYDSAGAYETNHQIYFFDGYADRKSPYSHVQYHCDADGLAKFTGLIYSRLGKHLLGDYAFPFAQHGINISIDDSTNKFSLKFNSSYLCTDFRKFEDKIRSYVNERLPRVHDADLPMDVEDLLELTSLLDDFCSFFVNLC